MARVALGAFEARPDGTWSCTRDVELTCHQQGQTRIFVRAGRVFVPRTTFAGHDDFTAYLQSVSTEAPPSRP